MPKTSKPRICFITSYELPLPGVRGGAIETLITNLLQQNEIHQQLDLTAVSIYDQLAEQESRKYQQTKFIYIHKNFSYQLLRVICKLRNLLFGQNVFGYNQAVLKKIKQQQFDYIIVEGGADVYFESFLRYFKKDSMVYHLHCNGTTNKHLEATFDKMIGVSDYVVREFRRDSQIKRFDVLRNGINSRLFIDDITLDEKRKLRAELGIKNDDFVVLYVGRLLEIKGVLELIEAFEQVPGDDTVLLIVGATGFSTSQMTPYLEKIQAKIASNPRIITTGYVDNDQIRKYYRLADMQAITSICEEASTLVVLEGMLSKLPIAATRSGGLTEIIEGRGIVINKDSRPQMIQDLTQAIVDFKQGNKTVDLDGNFDYAKSFSSEKYYQDFVKLIESYGI